MMEKTRRADLLTLIGIFLVSASLFIYEILITRLFSTILAYHFVFLIVSLSILGIGIGGLIVYKSRIKVTFGFLPLILGLSYVGSIITVYRLPYLDFFAVYIIISIIPFIVGGMFLSLAFRDNTGISHKLYFADLFGSTIGSILIILLMDNLGFMRTLFVVSSIALLSSFALNYRTRLMKIKILTVSLLILFMVLLAQGGFLNKIERDFTAYFTSPTTVLDYLKRQDNAEIKVSFTKWDSISRTDVIDEGDDEKSIVTDGGASAPMIKFDGNLESVKNLKNEIGFLPFSIGDNDDTLLIGSGGGNDVLFALLGKSKSIDAVEINPSTIDAVNKFKDFNGDIYNYEGVNLFIDDGRNFVEKIEKKYNNIYLSKVMTNVVSNSGMSMSENYIYTKEAFKTYFEHLKDGGYLSFVFHEPHDMLRGINTGIEVLLDLGVKREDIPNHFVAVNGLTVDMITKHNGSIAMPIVVFKKVPFTTEEITNIVSEANRQNRTLINMPQLGYIDFYNKYSQGLVELSDIYKGTIVDIKPTTDDKPFFFNASKGIPLTLIGLFLTITLIALVMYTKIKKSPVKNSALYFGAIGLGFMLIEIPLIQKSILFLGNPVKSFSYVLFSLLLSCGIGSYFSNRKIFNLRIKSRQLIFLIIPIITIVLQLAFPTMIDNFRVINDNLKLLVLSGMLFPLGFFLGMAFPKGISKLKERNQDEYIPLMWGVNGVLSVLGSVISLIISMTLGFTSTMILGGIVYLSIFIFSKWKCLEDWC